MGLVDLGVHMKPSAFLVDTVQAAPPARLEIRLAAIPPAMRGRHGIPANSEWAWAILQIQPGKQDVIVVGGHAESMSEAAARGEVELRNRKVQFNG